MVTVKRIDAVSAMRVGALVNAILFTVLAVLWALLQSVLLSGLSSLVGSSSFTISGAPASGFDPSSLAAAGLAGCGCGYLIGVIVSAIGGGIFGLLVAFSYNLIANWFGGLRLRIDADQEVEKLKREL